MVTAKVDKAIDLKLVALKQAAYDLLSLIDRVTKKGEYTDSDCLSMTRHLDEVADAGNVATEYMDGGIFTAEGWPE